MNVVIANSRFSKDHIMSTEPMLFFKKKSCISTNTLILCLSNTKNGKAPQPFISFIRDIIIYLYLLCYAIFILRNLPKHIATKIWDVYNMLCFNVSHVEISKL